MLRSHRIDLDDRGAELDEDSATCGASDDVAQIDDNEAGQGLRGGDARQRCAGTRGARRRRIDVAAGLERGIRLRARDPGGSADLRGGAPTNLCEDPRLMRLRIAFPLLPALDLNAGDARAAQLALPLRRRLLRERRLQQIGSVDVLGNVSEMASARLRPAYWMAAGS
jgi:hypothetical protein